MSILEIVIYTLMGGGFALWLTLTIIGEIRRRKHPELYKKGKKHEEEDED